MASQLYVLSDINDNYIDITEECENNVIAELLGRRRYVTDVERYNALITRLWRQPWDILTKSELWSINESNWLNPMNNWLKIAIIESPKFRHKSEKFCWLPREAEVAKYNCRAIIEFYDDYLIIRRITLFELFESKVLQSLESLDIIDPFERDEIMYHLRMDSDLQLYIGRIDGKCIDQGEQNGFFSILAKVIHKKVLHTCPAMYVAMWYGPQKLA